MYQSDFIEIRLNTKSNFIVWPGSHNLSQLCLLASRMCEFSFFLFPNVHVFSQAPLWAYLLCAVGLFVYQSLDAIDGKQARRTNSSSPLGELFDHGCDSLSTGTFITCWTLFPPHSSESETPNVPSCLFVSAVFVVLGTSIAVQMGTNPDWMFFCCFAGMFMFYCAHWQTYVSGTLRFGM